jgi:hypothetical protein
MNLSLPHNSPFPLAIFWQTGSKLSSHYAPELWIMIAGYRWRVDIGEKGA